MPTPGAAAVHAATGTFVVLIAVQVVVVQLLPAAAACAEQAATALGPVVFVAQVVVV